MSFLNNIISCWNGPKPGEIPEAPTLGGPDNPITVDQRWRMCDGIFDLEAELDPQGHVKIENLPANDGGGAREVAGINMRYDGPEEARLETMVKAKQYELAAHEAIQYMINDTDVVKAWCNHPAIECNLRDIVFNRGASGAMHILQEALGVTIDGDFGPVTESTEKAAEGDPEAFLNDLYRARVWYEQNVVGPRVNLEKGLMNRFAKARDFAKTFIPAPANV